jgi:hypothetical protein
VIKDRKNELKEQMLITYRSKLGFDPIIKDH